MSAIGIDVGGTKTAAAVVDESGAVRRHVRVATPLDPDGALDAMAAAVAELDAPELPVGVGVAGFVGLDGSTVLMAPNLGWCEEPLGLRLAARLGVPVHVENDANVAAWAEARFGAGVGRASVVCVTVGTGVGGGLVLDGRLQRGGFGCAGEVGHLPVVPDGLPCGCGQRGCLEQYASGTALVRAARRLLDSSAPGTAALRAACAGRPEDLHGPAITDLARRGDPAARALLAELGDWLSVGLAVLTAVLDPECFVIGGGVADAGDELLGPVRDGLRRRLPAGGARPGAEVVAARLGNDAGMIGAADLARIAEGAA
ncbi:MAG TPA: ROK family glucokinase [Sporichthyaceae bacterium]|nr:ROK family glucokinase [Sporichthyaceae bacterium]